MNRLPIDNLGTFSDTRVSDALAEADKECERCWLEFIQQPVYETLQAYREAWDYVDALYFELARRDNQRLIGEILNVLGPVRRRPMGKLGGVTI